MKLEAGYFYAPYIPIRVNLGKFKPRSGIMSKYGKKMLKEAGEYYSTELDFRPNPSVEDAVVKPVEHYDWHPDDYWITKKETKPVNPEDITDDFI